MKRRLLRHALARCVRPPALAEIVLHLRIVATTAAYPALLIAAASQFDRWWGADSPTRTLTLAGAYLLAMLGVWLLIHERPRLVERARRLRGAHGTAERSAIVERARSRWEP